MMMKEEFLKDLDRMTDFVARIENELTQLKSIIVVQKNKISTITNVQVDGGGGDDASGLKAQPMTITVPTSISINDSNKMPSKTVAAAAGSGPITRMKRNSSKSKVDETINNLLQAGDVVGDGDNTSCQKTRPVTVTVPTSINDSNEKSSNTVAVTGPITRLKRNTSKSKVDESTAKEISTSTIVQAGGGDNDDVSCLKTRPVTLTSINESTEKSTVVAAPGPITRMRRNSSKSKIDESTANANCPATPTDIVGPNSKIKPKEIAAKQPSKEPQTEIVPQIKTLTESQLDIQSTTTTSTTDFPPTISIIEHPKTPPFTDPNNDSNGPFDFLADFDFDSYIAATPTEMCVDSTVEAVKGASYYLLKDTENTAIQLAEYINQQRQGELTIENILDQVWTTKLPQQFQLEDGELPEETVQFSTTSNNNISSNISSTASTSTKNFIQDKMTRTRSQQVLNVDNVDNQQLMLHKDSRSRLPREKEIKTVPPSTISSNSYSTSSSSTLAKNHTQENLSRRRSQQVLPTNVDNQPRSHKDSRSRLSRDNEIKTVPPSNTTRSTINDSTSRNRSTSSSTKYLEKEKLSTRRSEPQQVSPSNQPLILHKDNRSKWEALGRRKIEPKIPSSSLLTTPTSERYQTPRKSLRITSNNDSPRKMTPIKVTPKKSPRRRKNTPKKKQQDPLKNLRSTKRSLFDLSTSSPETEKKQQEKPSSKPVLPETQVENKSKKSDQDLPQKPMIETKTATEKQIIVQEKVPEPAVVIPPSNKQPAEAPAEKKSNKSKSTQHHSHKPIAETEKTRLEKVIVPEPKTQVVQLIPPPNKQPQETRDEEKSKSRSRSRQHKSPKPIIETEKHAKTTIPEKVIVLEPKTVVIIPPPNKQPQETRDENEKKSKKRSHDHSHKPMIETKTETEKRSIPEKVIVPEPKVIIPLPNKQPQETRDEEKSNKSRSRHHKSPKSITETEKHAKTIPEKVIVPEPKVIIPPPNKQPETSVQEKSKKSRQHTSHNKSITETEKKTISESEKVIVSNTEVIIPPPNKRPQETRYENEKKSKKSKKSRRHKSHKPITETEKKTVIPEKVIVPEPEVVIPPSKKPKLSLSLSSTETVVVPEPDNEVVLPPPAKKKPKLTLSATEIVLHIQSKLKVEPPLQTQRVKVESTPPKKNALLNFFKFN